MKPRRVMSNTEEGFVVVGAFFSMVFGLPALILLIMNIVAKGVG